MPFIVREEENTPGAIIKQITTPTKIMREGVEYTILADEITVVTEEIASELEDKISQAATPFSRAIVSVGDYGYIKYVIAPPSIITNHNHSQENVSPFTFRCVGYDRVRSNDVDSAIRVVVGVFVDAHHAIVPLPAGARIKSVYNGRMMTITEPDFAPEMVGVDMLSYYIGVAGAAKFNGKVASKFLGGKSFNLALERRNIYMFTCAFNSYSAQCHTIPFNVRISTEDKLVGQCKDECSCKSKYGPLYAVYRHKKNQPPTYIMMCTNCVLLEKLVIEIPTNRTLFDALDELLEENTPESLERHEIISDLLDGELIEWRGVLCMRGKKWFYHPDVLNALAYGIAKDYPGYYWI